MSNKPIIHCKPVKNKQLEYRLELGSNTYIFEDREELLSFLSNGLFCASLKV